MNWNINGIKREWCKACHAVDRPIIRKKIDAEMGIYSDEKASRPIVGLDIDGEWCYKLSCAIKVVAAILLVAWLWCRICRMFRKLF